MSESGGHRHEHPGMGDTLPEQHGASRPSMDHGAAGHGGDDSGSNSHGDMGHTGHAMSGHDAPGHGVTDLGETDHGGHGLGDSGHHEAMIADFRRRFWIVLVLSVPIVVLSEMAQMLFGYMVMFPGSNLLLFALSGVVFFYGGWPFFTGARSEMRAGRPEMMMLITLAITSSFVYSTLTTFILRGSEFYFELSTLILIMLLGHWIDMRSQLGASRALEELVRLMPKTAHRIDASGSVTEVDLSELVPGDRILVKPGEKVPTDGQVVEGESSVNEAMLTGESAPVDKGPGMKVIGGSLNGDGALTVQVERLGNETYLAQVIRIVREAQAQKSRTQGLAQKAAGWLFYVAIVSGTATFLYWIFNAEASFALERMVTVLVIACPHALGLAVPLVNAVSTSIAARNGLLIRNRSQFEEGRNVDRVVFDKTGTLTRGEFGVTDLVPAEGVSEDELLATAASLEAQSGHPIAVGITRAARERNLALQGVTDFGSLTGAGLKGDIGGRTHYVVSPGEVKRRGIAYDTERFDAIASQGKTVVFVLEGDRLLGMVGVADVIRDTSRHIIDTLKGLGIDTVMMTGDNDRVASYVGRELGLSRVLSQVLPDEKSRNVELLQEGGARKVAMVGDGINDAPALAKADLGIAIGAGTDVAMETADVILTDSDPADVLQIIRLSRATYRKTVQNLLWAVGYNVLAIPLAAGVLASRGFVITPAIGAAVMSLSTIIVAINARLLKIEK